VRESESRRCAEERAVEAEAAVEKLRITVRNLFVLRQVEDASVRIDELGAKLWTPNPEPQILRQVEDASVRIDELGAKYEHARAEGTRLRGRIVESERAASEAGMKLGEAEIASRELSNKVWQQRTICCEAGLKEYLSNQY
jgi:hypothetical protein